MFRAIGFIIILWGISLFFGSALIAFERATVATFGAIEAAAIGFSTNLHNIQ